MPTIIDSFHARLSSRSRDAAAFARFHRSSSSVHLYFKAKSKALAESAGLSLLEICAAFEGALTEQNGAHQITRCAHDRLYGAIDGFAEVLATAEMRLRLDEPHGATIFDLITPAFDGLEAELTVRRKHSQALRNAFSEVSPLHHYFNGKAAGFAKDGSSSGGNLYALCAAYRRDAYRYRRNTIRRRHLLGLAAAAVEVIAIIERAEGSRKGAVRSGD
jgi:hypothetical protein